MRPLRFGVVGCGAIVTMHQLPALRRCPSVELVGLVDRDRDWAAKVAKRFRAPAAYDDHARLVERSTPS
jgi:predicted dehydrogenase